MNKFSEADYVSRIDPFSLSAEQLSADQRAFLKSLNDKLGEIEQGIKQEASHLIAAGNQKVADLFDWVEDFEVECFITFYLNENDPDFSDDRDNVLQQLWEYVTHQDWRHGIADGNNHNVFKRLNLVHPMENEHHCWLYHCLYDHTDLGWANVADKIRMPCCWQAQCIKKRDFG